MLGGEAHFAASVQKLGTNHMTSGGGGGFAETNYIKTCTKLFTWMTIIFAVVEWQEITPLFGLNKMEPNWTM